MAFLDRLLAIKSMNDPAYDALILEYIDRGEFSVLWATITSEYNGHKATFRVFGDALKIEGIRIGVSAKLAQIICYKLKCIFLTPKLVELMWYQRAITVAPVTKVHTLADTQYMATTKWLVEHSRGIDTQLVAQGNPIGLISSVGKVWGLSRALEARPMMAMNVGWTNTKDGPVCITSPPQGQVRCHIIQDPGTRHDPGHHDYSQIFEAAADECVVDGITMPTANVYTNLDLAGLASYEGALKLTAQPGVPYVPPIVKNTPCVGPNCPQLIAWTERGEEVDQIIAEAASDKTALIASALALTAVVGGFFGSMWLMGRPAPKFLTKSQRQREAA